MTNLLIISIGVAVAWMSACVKTHQTARFICSELQGSRGPMKNAGHVGGWRG